MIHTVKDFSIVSEAEVDVFFFFWNFLAFYVIQQMLAVWSLVLLPFLNPVCISGSSEFTYCWSLAWRTLSITLLAGEMSTIIQQFEHFLPFFGIGMKTDIFQSCGHCWVFQICWHIVYSIIASSFRVWNNSAEIPSLPLVLFVVMLPKAHLISHSRISSSRYDHTIMVIWVIKTFLYSSYLYSCQLFLICFASVRSLLLLSFIMPVLA